MSTATSNTQDNTQDATPAPAIPATTGEANDEVAVVAPPAVNADHNSSTNTEQATKKKTIDTKPATYNHVTFAVNKVKSSLRSFNFEKKSTIGHVHVRRKFLDEYGQRLVENACSHFDQPVVDGPITNGLVQTVAFAFDKHLPLTLRPQYFWLAISQAVAKHVEGNAEALRSKFVAFKGKKTLEIDVTAEAVQGFTPEDWARIAAGFNGQLKQYTKPGVIDAIGCETAFSDTTTAESTAAAMTVMDMCKSFFDFKYSTMCGFPSITLEGTRQDWDTLLHKATVLVENFTLPEFASWWLPALTSVLTRMAAARGHGTEPGPVDVEFWESMAKRGATHGSGAHSWISGWINVFYPLQTATKKNPFCEPFVGGDQYTKYVKHWSGGTVPEQKGLDTTDFPDGMCSVPVTLDNHPLEFRSGFIGMALDRNRAAVTPCVGWFVASGQCNRTKGHFGQEVMDVGHAKEILTRVGAVVPLMDFMNKPRDFSEYESKLERDAKNEQHATVLVGQLNALAEAEDQTSAKQRKKDLVEQLRTVVKKLPEKSWGRYVKYTGKMEKKKKSFFEKMFSR